MLHKLDDIHDPLFQNRTCFKIDLIKLKFAKLLRDIEGYQPLAIGVDILMSEADRMSPQQLLDHAQRDDPVLAAHLAALPSNDAELAEAIGAGPTVNRFVQDVLHLAGVPISRCGEAQETL